MIDNWLHSVVSKLWRC